MNQPPFGFYIQAAFFNIFGASIGNGTFLVTMFGLGSVALMYGIGKVMYNGITGFFAALLFAFTPWHLVLSRTFLIDGLCLFFSLLTLYVGLLAVRRGSFKLFLVSGLVFAAAISTKLYAVFLLIPLLLFLVYEQLKNPKRSVGWLAAFFGPALVSTFLWYQAITGVGVLSVFSHADLSVPSSGMVPTPFFVSNLLTNYTLGWFFVDAAILSVIVCLAGRQVFRKFWAADLICVATVACVLAVNVYLGVALNLKSPYLNGVKFDYQLLPLFSLLAASLVTKSLSIYGNAKNRLKADKIAFYAIVAIGIALVLAALVFNMLYTHGLSTSDFIIFKVAPDTNAGYSLFNYTPTSGSSILMLVQYVGFAVALSGLVWAGRFKLGRLIRRRS